MTDNSPETDSKYIDALLNENTRLSSDIRGLEAMNDKFLGSGITVIGAGFTYGIVGNRYEVFFYLPVALYGLFYFTLDRLRSMMWLGGYKHAVEDKINEIARRQLVTWELIVDKHRGRGDIIVRSSHFVFGLILAGADYYSIAAVTDHFASTNEWSKLYLYYFLIFVLTALLVLCIHRLNSAYKKAYAASKLILGVRGPDSCA